MDIVETEKIDKLLTDAETESHVGDTSPSIDDTKPLKSEIDADKEEGLWVETKIKGEVKRHNLLDPEVQKDWITNYQKGRFSAQVHEEAKRMYAEAKALKEESDKRNQEEEKRNLETRKWISESVKHRPEDPVDTYIQDDPVEQRIKRMEEVLSTRLKHEEAIQNRNEMEKLAQSWNAEINKFVQEYPSLNLPGAKIAVAQYQRQGVPMEQAIIMVHDEAIEKGFAYKSAPIIPPAAPAIVRKSGSGKPQEQKNKHPATLAEANEMTARMLNEAFGATK